MSIIDDLFENFNQITYYPILKSDLRPAKDEMDLKMMKIHAQLLEVWKIDLFSLFCSSYF